MGQGVEGMGAYSFWCKGLHGEHEKTPFVLVQKGGGAGKDNQGTLGDAAERM